MSLTYSAARRRPARRWILAPALACVGASLLFAAPIRVAGFGLPEPVFPLLVAFSWAALRPSLAGPVSLVALGIFLDLLWGGPLGLWPVCLLLAHGLTLAMRRVLSGEDSPVLWLWYALSCAIALLAGEAISRVLSGRWPSLVGLGLQWMVTAALFPLAGWMMERYQGRTVSLP